MALAWSAKALLYINTAINEWFHRKTLQVDQKVICSKSLMRESFTWTMYTGHSDAILLKNQP